MFMCILYYSLWCHDFIESWSSILYIQLLDIFLLCEDIFLQNSSLIKDFRMQRHFLQSLLCVAIWLQTKQILMWSCRPPKMGIMPDRNCADTLCSAYVSPWTEIWIWAVACQFSCLLENSQHILAWFQNSSPLIVFKNQKSHLHTILIPSTEARQAVFAAIQFKLCQVCSLLFFKTNKQNMSPSI